MTTPQAFRAERERGQRRLLETDDLTLKRFLRLDAAAYEDAADAGGLDAPTKELLGLVASMVLRCDDCVRYHAERCHELGIPERRIVEALDVALVVGGSITIPHLRRAMLFLDELRAEGRPA
jgi:AhpD family alkylhydroperoxidase